MITPPTPDYLDKLRHPHRARVRVQLLDTESEVLGEFNVITVNIVSDGLAQITRSATIFVGEDFYDSPARETLELLSVNDQMVRIQHAVDPLGQETDPDWVTIATLRIQDITRTTGRADWQIAAYDRSLLLSEFHLPTGQPMNDTYLGLIERLVAELTAPEGGPPPVLAPGVLIVDSSLDDEIEPAAGKSLPQGGNRLEEIQRMAEVIGGVFTNTPDGTFWLRPYLQTPETPIEFSIGENGTIEEITEEYTRTNQFNAVGIEFSATDDDAKIIKKLFYQYDNDPDSPTYYFGDFGRRNVFYAEEYDHVPGDTAAQRIANAKLALYSGALQGLSLSVLYNPLLVPGDRVTVRMPDDTVEDHIIDYIELNLGASGRMSIRTRLESLSDLYYGAVI